MADIKKFTGYTAQDNSTHATLKAATDYSRDLKVKAALQVFGGNTVDVDTSDETDMPTWLFNNKDAVLAAFNQTVLTRKPRVAKPKASPSAVVLQPLNSLAALKNAPVPAAAHAGVFDLAE